MSAAIAVFAFEAVCVLADLLDGAVHERLVLLGILVAVLYLSARDQTRSRKRRQPLIETSDSTEQPSRSRR